jgi:predicted GTPase
LARSIARRLRDRGMRVVVIRHPMPYGDLERQAVQRFASTEDLTDGRCTLEEREEYEPHIALGNVVFAGVDYLRIVAEAEREADIILWDGGNNDFPFVRPDLHLVLVDPLRAGDETSYHPGEAVLRTADIVVIAKSDAAPPAGIAAVTAAARSINSRATIVSGISPVTLDFPERVRGRRVLVVEDGPTITHGGMAFGAGYVAAKSAEAADIIDPRPFAPDELRRIYDQYPHIGPVLPAIGYGEAQIKALKQTIDAAAADAIVVATPIDLAALLPITKPVARARYEFAEPGEPKLPGLIDEFLRRRQLAQTGERTVHR